MAAKHSQIRTQHRPRGLIPIATFAADRKLGEGTFGEVYTARDIRTSEVVALKRIIPLKEADGFPITSLREIKILKVLRHPNILFLQDLAIEKHQNSRIRSTIYMVTPYMDHDLCGMLKNPAIKLTEPMIKCYMIQFLRGLEYLHGSYIFHRDIKSANLLVNNRGILQIADFGLARLYDGDLPRTGRGGGEAHRSYTALVVTRWYRPPELFMGLRYYTSAIDLWGAGLIFAEMFEKKPIMQGNTDLAQAHMIFELVGSPDESNMPGSTLMIDSNPELKIELGRVERRTGNMRRRFKQLSEPALSFMASFLTLDWRKRTNAIDALQHPYLNSEPLPLKPSDIPQFEQSHEMDYQPGVPRMNLPPVPLANDAGQAHLEPQRDRRPNGHPPRAEEPRHNNHQPPIADGWGPDGSSYPQDRNPYPQDRNCHPQDRNSHLHERSSHPQDRNTHTQERNPHPQDRYRERPQDPRDRRPHHPFDPRDRDRNGLYDRERPPTGPAPPPRRRPAWERDPQPLPYDDPRTGLHPNGGGRAHSPPPREPGRAYQNGGPRGYAYPNAPMQRQHQQHHQQQERNEGRVRGRSRSPERRGGRGPAGADGHQLPPRPDWVNSGARGPRDGW